jgi:hypothetical protein
LRFCRLLLTTSCYYLLLLPLAISFSHTYTHTHTNTSTHIYTHTHTHTQARAFTRVRNSWKCGLEVVVCGFMPSSFTTVFTIHAIFIPVGSSIHATFIHYCLHSSCFFTPNLIIFSFMHFHASVSKFGFMPSSFILIK